MSSIQMFNLNGVVDAEFCFERADVGISTGCIYIDFPAARGSGEQPGQAGDGFKTVVGQSLHRPLWSL
jgi:hypothetical protein